MLRAAGALLLIALAAYACHLSTQEVERRLSECEGALLLVRHLALQIVDYHAPLEAAIASFENQALEACGFLAAARESGLGPALASARMALGEEERGVLLRLDGRIKTPALREAAAACAEAEGSLARLLEKEKREGGARGKAARALILFFAMTALLVLG